MKVTIFSGFEIVSLSYGFFFRTRIVRRQTGLHFFGTVAPSFETRNCFLYLFDFVFFEIQGFPFITAESRLLSAVLLRGRHFGLRKLAFFATSGAILKCRVFAKSAFPI